MSNNDTSNKGSPEEYILFKDEEDNSTSSEIASEKSKIIYKLGAFTISNYIVLMTFLSIVFCLIAFVSKIFLLIFLAISLGLFISYKNFNFIFHKQISSYCGNLVNRVRNWKNKSDDVYEAYEDKIFKLVNI
jgi:hypothetical protein